MGPSLAKASRPKFAILSLACLLLPLPSSWLALHFFPPKGDYLGYGGLGIVLTVFILALTCGIILAVTSLLRREYPRLLALACLLVNVTVLGWVIINLPG